MVNSSMGKVTISGDFIDESKAVGVLTIVYQTAQEDPEISYLLDLRIAGKPSVSFTLGHTSIHPSHMLSLSLFTVEENGLPSSMSATHPKSVSATLVKDATSG